MRSSLFIRSVRSFCVPAKSSLGSLSSIYLTKERTFSSTKLFFQKHHDIESDESEYESESEPGSVEAKRSFASALLKHIDGESIDVDAATVPDTEDPFMGVNDDIRRSLVRLGYQKLMPVQRSTFQIISEGRDAVVQSHTGSGKTVAFTLPVLNSLKPPSNRFQNRDPRVLILAPTRELAHQIGEVVTQLSSKFTTITIYGGVSIGPQISRLRAGTDIVIGTPGRVKDLLQQGVLRLSDIKFFVLDEADRMLDMGFGEDIKDIFNSIEVPKEERQCLLFSATMPVWVSEVAAKYLKKPKIINLVSSENRTPAQIKHLVFQPNSANEKIELLKNLVANMVNGRALIFVNQKKNADLLSQYVHGAVALHGDKSQYERQKCLNDFRKGIRPILIATDVAARGLDVPDIDIVIQFDVPLTTEDYIHRSGRCGRAGKSGTCISLALSSEIDVIYNLARKQNIEFRTCPVPSGENFVKEAIKSKTEDMRLVRKHTMEYFLDRAKKILKDQDAVETVARALAVLTNTKTPPKGSTSVITQSKDHITVELSSSKASNKRAMNKVLDEHSAKGKIEDSKSVYADIPSDLLESLEEKAEILNIRTKEVDSIPLVVPPVIRGQHNRGSRGGRGSYTDRRSGGYSDRRGSGGRGGYSDRRGSGGYSDRRGGSGGYSDRRGGSGRGGYSDRRGGGYSDRRSGYGGSGRDLGQDIDLFPRRKGRSMESFDDEWSF